MRWAGIVTIVFFISLGCGGSSGSGDGDGGPGSGIDGGPGGGGGNNGCPAYQKECGSSCVVTATDPMNCGDCGVECTGNTACSAGVCSSTCLGGLQVCDNTCVDIQSDSNHCGDCNDPCEAGQGCVDGSCVASVSVGPEPTTCADSLPPEVSDGTTTSCTGDIAETTFRWALCSCTDVVITNPMETSAFNSAAGTSGLGGGVGLNGTYDAASEVDVGGDLWASAAGGLSSTNPTTVAQQLHVGGPVEASGSFSVGEDAFIDGNLTTSDTFAIAGDLHIDGTTSGTVTYASVISEPVSVADPCDCGNARLDVAAIVTAGATSNDNTAVSLDPDVLVKPSTDTRIDLPCGSYYFSTIDVEVSTVIHVHGRTVLYVGGDIVATAPLTITLDPDAQLDIFVDGTINVSNPFKVGSVLYPALTRFYVAGTDTISLTNPTDIGGFFYAAYGLVDIQNPLDVYGGVIAGDYNADNPVKIFYDEEVLRAGDDCPGDPGDGGCTSCTDCNGQACNGGTCGQCTTDADCCAPLRCNNGVCESTYIIE